MSARGPIGSRWPARVKGWAGDDRAARPRRAAPSARAARSGRRVGRRADGGAVLGPLRRGGLLALDAERGVLLQHRVSWSHFGDTWALPGGARHEGESATDGALREAAEEAGVPDAADPPAPLSVLDLGYWSYTTLVGDVIEPFEPTISDPESRELAVGAGRRRRRAARCIPASRRRGRRCARCSASAPRSSWTSRTSMGSVPDGWWRDRAGAAGAAHRTGRRARRDAGCRPARWTCREHTLVPGVGRRRRRQARARWTRAHRRSRWSRADGIRRRRDRRARPRVSSRRVAPSRSSRATAGWRSG